MRLEDDSLFCSGKGDLKNFYELEEWRKMIQYETCLDIVFFDHLKKGGNFNRS